MDGGGRHETVAKTGISAGGGAMTSSAIATL